MVYGQAPEHNGFKLIVLTDLRSDIPDFFEIGHPVFFFFSYFFKKIRKIRLRSDKIFFMFF